MTGRSRRHGRRTGKEGDHTPTLPGRSASEIAQIITKVDAALKLFAWHPPIQQIFDRPAGR